MHITDSYAADWIDGPVGAPHARMANTAIKKSMGAWGAEAEDYTFRSLDLKAGPVLLANRKFGGRDDPMVVSDDDNSGEAEARKKYLIQVLNSHRARSAALVWDTEGAVSEITRVRAVEGQQGSDFSTAWNALGSALRADTNVLVAASKGLLDIFKTLALIDREGYSAIKRASRQRRAMNSHLAILMPILEGAGFDCSEPYEDGLGAVVVDFLKSEDRVTFAFDVAAIQMLYIEGGVVRSKYFENLAPLQMAMLDFVREKFREA